MRSLEEDIQIFMSRFSTGDDCWIWTGGIGARGYGLVYFQGKVRRAHRVVYELLVGPIPEGLVLDHLCRIKLCMNPKHLEPVTNAENLRRGIRVNGNTGKTHCGQGHEFTNENTYIRGNGARSCRSCHRVWSKAYRTKVTT